MYTIYQNEALTQLRKLPSQEADTLLTDPPYCSGGSSETAKMQAKYQGGISSDRDKQTWFVGDNMTTGGLVWLLREVLVESFRVLKPDASALIFTDWRMIHHLVPALESAGFRYRNLVVWDKNSIGTGSGFRPRHEMILHFTKGKFAPQVKNVGNVIPCNRVPGTQRVHPTQKPLPLLKNLIQVTTPEKGVVLDPFMGSGSTGVAAEHLNRDFIGIERDPTIYQSAEDRLTNITLSI